LFGFLAKQLFLKKFWRLPVVFLFLSIILFHCYHTTVFLPNWRSINDLKNVAKIIFENIGEDQSFNLATIQKEEDRWDRNSVDYRYFVETFGKKRALDWYPENYKKSEYLFVIDETGNAEVLKSNIMEIQEFNPKKIVSRWETSKGIVIYKLVK